MVLLAPTMNWVICIVVSDRLMGVGTRIEKAVSV
jgi:hypothetical protein